MIETKKILVVEDEITLQNVIKTKLEINGFTVLTARTISDALSEIENHNDIKAVWLDHYLLGKENGLDFLAALRNEDSAYKDIAVFVVSNTASEEKVKSYLKLGVSKYYTKSDSPLTKIIEDIESSI